MTPMNKHLVSVMVLAAVAVGTTASASAFNASGKASLALWPFGRDDRREFREEQKEKREEFRDERASKAREFREEQKEKREEFREERASKSQELRDKAKERLSQARKELIKKWWSRAERRLRGIIDRQRRLADRIEARIEKLEDAGKDADEQKDALAAARLKIDASATALASASVGVDAVIANNVPADAFRKLHDLHKGVVGKIRESHRALVQVIVSLKALKATPSPSVSASPSPTQTP